MAGASLLCVAACAVGWILACLPSQDRPWDVTPGSASRQTLQNVGRAWEHAYQLCIPEKCSILNWLAWDHTKGKHFITIYPCEHHLWWEHIAKFKRWPRMSPISVQTSERRSNPPSLSCSPHIASTFGKEWSPANRLRRTGESSERECARRCKRSESKRKRQQVRES